MDASSLQKGVMISEFKYSKSNCNTQAITETINEIMKRTLGKFIDW
jgi:hypothetical protein